MANMKKALIALNDALEFKLPELLNGAFGIQYDAFGDDGVTAAVGTYVAEASINRVEWYPLKITTNQKVDVDNLAAPGLGFCEAPGYTYGRVRCSVAGGGAGHGAMISVNPREG